PNYRAVSAEIATANKSGERLILPSLRAGGTPDTVDVDLQIEDRNPLHGSLEVNDRFSSRTRRLRVSAGLRHANLFQLGHTLSVQGQMTPEDPGQSWSVSGSYVAPIGHKGFSVLGYAVKSNSDVSAVNGVGVLGTGEIYGLRGLYSFTSGSGTNLVVHQISAGIDYKVFKESLVLGSENSKTPIDYVPITAQYSRMVSRDDYDWDITVGVNAGLRGLSATNEEFGLKRYNASASWFVLRSELGFTYKFPGDWRLGARVSGQLASGPLISNEQFSAGGLDSVRGYYESQELGDDGASVQLQASSPQFLKNTGPIDEVSLFAFSDAAMLRIRDPLTGQKPETYLLSVGGGLNARLLKRLNLSALIAAPLRETDGVKTDIDDTLRVQFRAWTEF
ncbi:MAG TPA: ShlB/FhaC/HecB family hemolysin secretion/activation protein, partial [Sphingomonadaceae bacterium]|nr:ShlB/FhaC/HecB family hemolysin secretion/activation protein [Sphingomonadaceae bacterium]